MKIVRPSNKQIKKIKLNLTLNSLRNLKTKLSNILSND